MAGVATGARRSSLMSMAKATSYDSDIFGRRQSGSRVREAEAALSEVAAIKAALQSGDA